MEGNESSDQSLGGHGRDFKHLHADLLRYASYRQGAIRRLPASQLTPSWLKNNGTFRPVLIPASEGANSPIVRLPAAGLSPESVSAALGPTFQVQPIDVPSQEEGPVWTLHQWSLYWKKKTPKDQATGQASAPTAPTPAAATAPSVAAAATSPDDEVNSGTLRRKASSSRLEGIHADYTRRLLALSSLPISETPLAKEISPPAAIKAVDLRASLGLEQASPASQSPLTLSMYPNKSFVNSTMAPSGASLWFHVVSGALSLALTPPTPRNLANYAAWACGAQHTGIFLPSKCEGVAKAELFAGDTLILPPGWSYAIAVTSSAVVLSGAFLRADSVAVHLDVLRIEEAARVSPRQRYPEIKQLIWLAAARYATALSKSAARKVENFEAQVATRAEVMQREDTAAAGHAAAMAKAQAYRAPAVAEQAGGSHRPSSGNAAARQGGTERKRRRGRDIDNFLESDSGDSGAGRGYGGEESEDEAEWRPGPKTTRLGDTNERADSVLGIGNEEEEEGEEDDDWIGSDDDFDLKPPETKRFRRGGSPPIATGTGTRVSLRHHGRLPTRLAAALHGDDVFDDQEESGSRKRARSPATGPIKLKIKLPIAAAGSPKVAAPLHNNNIASSSPIKLKIKRPVIPQVDGAWDEGSCLPSVDDLSEGEEQGLGAMLCMLRQWLRETPAAAAAAPVPKPWDFVARLEVSMKILGLSLEPPMCTCLTAVSSTTLEQTGAALQEPFTIQVVEGGGGKVHLGGLGGFDDHAAALHEDEDESGENAAVVEESGDPRSSPVGGLGVGGTTGAGKSTAPLQRTTATKAAPAKPQVRSMKKLSTKDRLKKKLGL